MIKVSILKFFEGVCQPGTTSMLPLNLTVVKTSVAIASYTTTWHFRDQSTGL
jgi:hypothetical protein